MNFQRFPNSKKNSFRGNYLRKYGSCKTLWLALAGINREKKTCWDCNIHKLSRISIIDKITLQQKLEYHPHWSGSFILLHKGRKVFLKSPELLVKVHIFCGLLRIYEIYLDVRLGSSQATAKDHYLSSFRELVLFRIWQRMPIRWSVCRSPIE